MNKLQQQTLALAAILQTATLANQLASTGVCDLKNSNASLKSIISVGNDIKDIFTSEQDLSTGISTLKVIFDKKPKHMQNIVLYSLAFMSLETKLMKNKNLLHKISTEIDAIKNQSLFEANSADSKAKFAHLYKSTISNLSPKIMVNGEKIYLSNQSIKNHIRALLLAGIRATSLWKSQGGSTWQLFVKRKKMLKFINSIDF